MTNFLDNITTGLRDGQAVDTISDAMFTRTVALTGVTNTQAVRFPAGWRNVDAELYVTTAGSAATTNNVTLQLSPGATLAFNSVGSATGIFRAPTMTSAATFALGSTTELSANVITSSTDAAFAGQLVIRFNRRG